MKTTNSRYEKAKRHAKKLMLNGDIAQYLLKLRELYNSGPVGPQPA